MPEMTASEWESYCTALATDPLAPVEAVLVAYVLRFSGADIGEVMGYRRQVDNAAVPGMTSRDVRTKDGVTRLRFKRQKVDKSPERLVPYPSRLAAELSAYIVEVNVAPTVPLFDLDHRPAFEAAHRRACKRIGRADLRIKDFRHLAAIAWAQAGTRLERIKEWLGHSTIRQTEIYARFAPDDSIDAPLAERAASIALGVAV